MYTSKLGLVRMGEKKNSNEYNISWENKSTEVQAELIIQMN